MFDDYERAMWTKIKEARFLMCDALMRCDDGMTEERLEVDQWHYAFLQGSRALNELEEIVALIVKIRQRRLKLSHCHGETSIEES